MMKYVVLIAALVAIAQAGKVDFVDCGNHETKELDVSGCTGKVCTIHKGKRLDIGGEVMANQDTNHLEIKILAEVNGVEIEMPGGYEKNGCKFVKCPVHKGQDIKFSVGYEIPSVLPSIDAVITAKIIGDHGVGACVKFQAHVVD